MSVKGYIISEASKAVKVEPHVLRYWEEELTMDIPRNEMGHRCYREEDIKLLCSVKELKDKGFQLKAIKLLLPDIAKVKTLDNEQLLSLRDKLDEAIFLTEENSETGKKEPAKNDCGDEEITDRMLRFRGMMTDIVGEALLSNNEIIARKLSSTVKEALFKEMDYLFRNSEEHEEERFRKLDKTIREYQLGRHQAAAVSEKKRKFRIFSKA